MRNRISKEAFWLIAFFLAALLLSPSLRYLLLPDSILKSDQLLTYNWGATIDSFVIGVSGVLALLIVRSIKVEKKWLFAALLLALVTALNINTIERLATFAIWSVRGFS
jgi:hypothetical protein